MAYNDEGHAAPAKQDPSKHPHVSSGPKGGQFAPKGSTGSRSTAKRPVARKPAPKPAPVAKPATRLPDLRMGRNNDPARVQQLQALISELRLGNLHLDGQFGPDTEAAVKRIQATLGLKPTGHATSSLIKRLQDAHKLSPCVAKAGSKVHASAGEVDGEVDEDDDQNPELVTIRPGGELFDLAHYTDGTVLVSDDQGDLAELDADDASAVAEALRSQEPADLGWLRVEWGDAGPALVGDDLELSIPAGDVEDFAAGLSGEPVAAAAGHDTHPGGEELRRYWTEDPEGLAKWVSSPTPWTTLYHHLVKFASSPEEAKKWASAWFLRVFRFASGSDLNRVTHGHPPRGHKVGPG